MQEKRRLQRFELKVSARIEGLGKKQKKDVLHLVTSDICAGGAFFDTDRSLPEGTEVKIDLVLPIGGLKGLALKYDHALINLTGKVVREESRGMAVRFNDDYTIRPRKKNILAAPKNEKQDSASGSLKNSRPSRAIAQEKRS